MRQVSGGCTFGGLRLGEPWHGLAGCRVQPAEVAATQTRLAIQMNAKQRAAAKLKEAARKVREARVAATMTDAAPLSTSPPSSNLNRDANTSCTTGGLGRVSGRIEMSAHQTVLRDNAYRLVGGRRRRGNVNRRVTATRIAITTNTIYHYHNHHLQRLGGRRVAATDPG